MAEVDFVRSRPGVRVKVRFTPSQAVFDTSPVRWRDWVVRFWLAVVASLALAWIGTLAYFAGAPEAVAVACAVPGGVWLVGLLVYGVLAVLTKIVTFGFVELNLQWLARRIDGRASVQPAGALATDAVEGVASRRRFRRTVVHVRTTDRGSVTFTRWGSRRDGRALAHGFQALAEASGSYAVGR
ncbi:MAG: hypothetical protein HOV66_07690 [Streptomycetaceae bacterium]|nr:hypothetical protein [Streptomycetaceae bacterium]